MNNFTGSEEHLKLCTVMFQNMFPPINVQTVRLSQCQRVLLLNYNPDTKLIDMRHYAVTAQPTGVSKSIRKLVQKQDVPNLGGMEDVAEFVTR
jgi:ribosome biogenesis protein SSF1/2